MGRPRKEPTTVIHIRIPVTLYKALQRLAEDEKRSINNTVMRLLHALFSRNTSIEIRALKRLHKR